jgi:transposase
VRGVEILAVPADRQQGPVAACLRAIPDHLRPSSERACTEMSAGFVRALAAEAPGAELGIARCHVARASRDGAATGRKQACKRLKSALPKAQPAERRGAMWPFRQRPADRKAQEAARLQRVCTSPPTSAAACHLREDRTALCARDDPKAGARCAIRAWGTRGRAPGLTACESARGTLERWREELTHDGQGRLTSGFGAGVNSRVTGLKRRCSGRFNVGRRCQRLTCARHGHQRFGHS